MKQTNFNLSNASALLLAVARLLATSPTRTSATRLRAVRSAQHMPMVTNMEVDGQTVEVFYLMTSAEADRHTRRDECGPVASGLERRWMECARRQRKSGNDDAQFSTQNATHWGDIANQYWPKACCDLGAGLPLLDAFCVIPSSRPRVPAGVVMKCGVRSEAGGGGRRLAG